MAPGRKLVTRLLGRWCLLALPALASGSAFAQSFSMDGFKDCVRADDGRPVCISNATGSYHFVTETFFQEFERRAAAPSTPAPSPVPVPVHRPPQVIHGQFPTGVPRSPEEVYNIASQSVVLIAIIKDKGEVVGQGSGVVVRPDIIATNCHVIEGAEQGGVLYRDEVYEPLTIVAERQDRDLCLVRAVNLPAPPINLGSVTQVHVGQKVYAIGAPHGLELTLSEGLVSALRKRDETYPLIQTSAPISQGSSGGALVTEEAALIGLTTMIHKEGQNLNFAIPVDWIREFPAIQ